MNPAVPADGEVNPMKEFTYASAFRGPTLLDAVALIHAAQYNRNDQAPPSTVPWPDEDRQWEPLLPLLRGRLPILTLAP